MMDISKKFGIDYTSKNPDYLAFLGDAKRLGEIILEINSLIDELEIIFQRHNICLKNRLHLEKDLEELKVLNHDLVNLAQLAQTEKK